MHALAKLHGKGSVQARDLTDNKVSMIEENIERCAGRQMPSRYLSGMHVFLDPQAVEKADVVIADLPCSGLGVIGRKSDIKYRMTPEQVADIAALQREILSVVWQYVKPGGILMYSTCTLTKAENQDNRDWFLENSPFTLLEEKIAAIGRNRWLLHDKMQEKQGIIQWRRKISNQWIWKN